MKYLLPLALIFSSCAAPSGKNVDIVLCNRSGEKIEVVAKAGIFHKKIEIDPYSNWSGWIPVVFVNGKIEVEIRLPKP